MATSDVAICNLAAQKLGAKRIVSLTEDSTEAREFNACYTAMRDAELRRHPWNFAIARLSIAADADAPAFGPAGFFTLPADFLRLLPKDPEEDINDLDWRIEGKKIATNDTAPLEVRYIYRVEDPNDFDPLFVETLACRIALQTCEKLTQSNAKKAAITQEYKDAIAEAKRTNGIENVPREPPADTWDTARL